MDHDRRLGLHPDYARKYGTISPGVFSRSVKYAETWLYGTVGVRGAPSHRPSLFLYPAGAQSAAEPRVPIPRFVPAASGSHRTTRNLCQCPDTARGAICRQCGVRRARPQTRARQTLLAVTNTQDQPRIVPAAQDPYNLMRKSRLGVGEIKETSIINPKMKQKRTRSSSPINKKENCTSFETFKPKVESTWVRDNEVWESDSESDGNENISRPKSILECSLNPYDLNKNKKDVSSDDDLSDSTMQINSKLKILRPKLKKTEIKNRKCNIPEPKKLLDIPYRMNGARFDSKEHSRPSTNSVESCVSEQPQRPPRKQKLKSRLTRQRSTSSPNLSIKSILKKQENESNYQSREVQLKMVKPVQSTLKKKKQVQFLVMGSAPVESPDSERMVVELVDEKATSCEVFDEEVQNEETVRFEELPAGSEPVAGDRKPLAEDACVANLDSVQDDDDEETRSGQTTLQRSFSDRRPSSTNLTDPSTSPPNSALFSDTMALRTRPVRHDTRLLFNPDPLKTRPREPPPDPPPKNRREPQILVQNIPPPSIKLCDDCESGKTVVTISETKRTSIIINGNDPPLSGQRTSVIINNFQPEDSNKVTINVQHDDTTTVIPVLSSDADNKTTLVVGSQPLPEPSRYLFASQTLLDNLDPVEAVRRNLVPHVCGKQDPITPSLVEKLKEDRERTNSLRQLSQLFTNKSNLQQQPELPSESLLSAYQARKMFEETSSSCSGSITSRNTSRSSSFNDCNTRPFLPLAVARSQFYVASDSDETVTQELDKLEDEYVIRNGLITENKDNIYETINEPIYDKIGIKLTTEESDDDVPPPLPTTLPPSLDQLEPMELRPSKSIFEGASKYDILSYLVDAKDRIEEDLYNLDPRRLELIEHRRMESLDGSELSTSKASDSGIDLGPASTSSDSSEEPPLIPWKGSTEIERNDSGVGSETSQTCRSKWQGSGATLRDHLCEDCDQTVETQVTDSGVMYAPLICRKCAKKRSERKEIITEIFETEEKYGRDLRIIMEEFYKPMLVAGLLTPDQLSAIFLNVEELMDNSEALTEKLRDTLDIATEQGDEELLTVNVGRLFLDAKPMLHTFESYCTRQASAALLLASLEKEKELLRIFLRVSQMENAVLRRMNLNSFLMVPVQRVTKYPLLLARLYKVTPAHHESRELLKQAQHAIELHLEHMNAEARDGGGARVWRRFSTSAARKSAAELELTSIKIRKLAVDMLEWGHDEVRFVVEGRLLFAQADGNWKRGRTVKLQPVFALLTTLGKPNSKYRLDNHDSQLAFPCKTGIREATLLFIKEKSGRFTLIREPLYLDKLIICCDPDSEELLELQELSTKETFLLKAEDLDRTKEWYRLLQYHAQILGGWRRRRNALANIMITGITYAA